MLGTGWKPALRPLRLYRREQGAQNVRNTRNLGILSKDFPAGRKVMNNLVDDD